METYPEKLPEPRIYLPLSKCQLIWLCSIPKKHEGPPLPENVQTISPKPLHRKWSSLCKGAVWYQSFSRQISVFGVVLSYCGTRPDLVDKYYSHRIDRLFALSGTE